MILSIVDRSQKFLIDKLDLTSCLLLAATAHSERWYLIQKKKMRKTKVMRTLRREIIVDLKKRMKMAAKTMGKLWFNFESKLLLRGLV